MNCVREPRILTIATEHGRPTAPAYRGPATPGARRRATTPCSSRSPSWCRPGGSSPRSSTVRALPGRLSILSVFHSKSVCIGLLYGRAGCLIVQKRRFPARAEIDNSKPEPVRPRIERLTEVAEGDTREKWWRVTRICAAQQVPYPFGSLYPPSFARWAAANGVPQPGEADGAMQTTPRWSPRPSMLGGPDGTAATPRTGAAGLLHGDSPGGFGHQLSPRLQAKADELVALREQLRDLEVAGGQALIYRDASTRSSIGIPAPSF